jgi:hypothetical protein
VKDREEATVSRPNSQYASMLGVAVHDEAVRTNPKSR